LNNAPLPEDGAQHDATTYQSPRQVLLTFFPSIVLPMFMAAMDQTIVATALPAIAGGLGDVERVSWVVVAYLLGSTMVTPIYGRLGDALGRRRMMGTALVIFVLASVACAMAGSLPALAAARLAQGIGGGGLMALSQALIGEHVPPRQRGRYQGYIVTVFVSASSIGPVAGGWLTEVFGWPSVFLINLPLGVVAMLLLARLPARPPHAARVVFDFLGMTLFIAFVIPLLLALEQAQRLSPQNLPTTLGLLAFSIVALVALLWQESRAPQPLLPIALLRQKVIGRATAMGSCVGAIMVPMVAFTPIYLEVVRGLSPAQAGLFLLPLTAGISCGSLVTGQLVTRTGHTALFPSIGQPFVCAGLLVLALFLDVLPMPFLVADLAVVSVFMGTTMVVVQITTQISAGPRNLGVVSASTQLARSLGSSFGTALAGAVLFAAVSLADPGLAHLFGQLMEHGAEVLARLGPEHAATVHDELTGAFRAVYAALACVAAIATLLAWNLSMRRVT